LGRFAAVSLTVMNDAAATRVMLKMINPASVNWNTLLASATSFFRSLLICKKPPTSPSAVWYKPFVPFLFRN